MPNCIIIGISRINKYMSFFNTLVKYKIGCILNEMDLNIIEKNKLIFI